MFGILVYQQFFGIIKTRNCKQFFAPKKLFVYKNPFNTIPSAIRYVIHILNGLATF